MNFIALSDDHCFVTVNQAGDIVPDFGQLGLYYLDTRYLSKWQLVEDHGLNLLSSGMSLDGIHESFYTDSQQLVLLKRTQWISCDIFFDEVELSNYGQADLSLKLAWNWKTDFTDIFVVRNYLGQMTGTLLPSNIQANRVAWEYLAEDNTPTSFEIVFSIVPTSLTSNGSSFEICLQPQEQRRIGSAVILNSRGWDVDFLKAKHLRQESFRNWQSTNTSIYTDNHTLTQALTTASGDIFALQQDLGFGNILAAGIPWFYVLFGRDSIIAALETLLLRPELAKATLLTLAHYQGQEVNPWRDEQPGKIPHELRQGELARLGKVPHTPYYGSVDSTALFLVLLAEYVAWTGEDQLLLELELKVEAALGWLDQYGDKNQDGFVRYAKESAAGLGNQGWKDSEDSMLFADGAQASGPIALVEVQGYTYWAKKKLAPHLARLGRTTWAQRLDTEAEELAGRIRHNFIGPAGWAMALDGEDCRVDSKSSNPGHLLATGMLSPNEAGELAEQLLAEDLFTHFGIRTMSDRCGGYNPLSYHNGSIWPHDNALITWGLARTGQHAKAQTVCRSILEASKHFPQYRLPELYAGLGTSLVPYPVACSPQAWAAGTPFLLLRAILGIEPDLPNGTVYLRPSLPEWLPAITIEGLKFGTAMVSLSCTRQGEKTMCKLLQNTGELKVINVYTGEAISV